MAASRSFGLFNSTHTNPSSHKTSCESYVSYLSKFTTVAAAEAALSTIKSDIERFETFKAIQHFDALLNVFLNCVINGEVEKADELIRSHRHYALLLMTYKSVTKNDSDREYCDAAFEMALYTQNKPMCDLMFNYLFRESHAVTLASKKRFYAIYPNGVPPEAPAFDFNEIAAAITNASVFEINDELSNVKNASALCKAFNSFRETFAYQSRQEKVFNPRHLLEAYRTYQKQFSEWSMGQQMVFWRRVIGYVQYLMPNYYLRAIRQGLNHFLHSGRDVHEMMPLISQNAMDHSHAYAYGDSNPYLYYDRKLESLVTGFEVFLMKVQKEFQSYSISIESIPTDAQTYFNRAYAYQSKNKYKLAMADYRVAIELDNGFVTNNDFNNIITMFDDIKELTPKTQQLLLAKFLDLIVGIKGQDLTEIAAKIYSQIEWVGHHLNEHEPKKFNL